MRYEDAKELVFASGQRNSIPAIGAERAGQRVERKACEVEGGFAGFSIGGRGWRGSPEHAADARKQFTEIEWFGDVVVRAKFQPDHPVHRFAAAGDDDERAIPAFAQLAR